LEEEEHDKRLLESSTNDAVLEKQVLQNKVERIEAVKADYDAYVSELISRREEAEKCEVRLKYSWYSLLYKYRVAVYENMHCIKKKINEVCERKTELLSRLEKCKERVCAEKELQHINDVMCAYSNWVKWKELFAQKEKAEVVVKELSALVNGKEILDDGEEGKVEMINMVADLRAGAEYMAFITESFDGFREWIYTEKIGPLITRKVNYVLQMICSDDRPISLETEFLDVTKTLSWFIADGGSRPVIQKASGYQRFIIGLAMRIAMNSMGLSGIKFKDLFIDEGFTSLDSDNLEKVPEFLEGLIDFYDTILLVTHLEDLKLYGYNIDILYGNGLSQIQFADASVIEKVEAASRAKKKGGRPPKNSVIVTKNL
jgi:exonuclease SbcC